MMDRIALDDTRFIFATNFSGDPKRDRFGDSRRKANIIIPTAEQAKEMTKAGFKVRQTKPSAEQAAANDFVPEYYILAQVKYRKTNGEAVKYPPNVYLVTPGKDPVLLTEDTVSCLDQIRVKNVNVILNPHEYDGANGSGLSLYVRTMYVEQDVDDDPYAERYRRTGEFAPVEYDEQPF